MAHLTDEEQVVMLVMAAVSDAMKKTASKQIHGSVVPTNADYSPNINPVSIEQCGHFQRANVPENEVCSCNGHPDVDACEPCKPQVSLNSRVHGQAFGKNATNGENKKNQKRSVFGSWELLADILKNHQVRNSTGCVCSGLRWLWGAHMSASCSERHNIPVYIAGGQMQAA